VDPALLLSSGKNTEIFCWNMQTGKIQCEVNNTRVSSEKAVFTNALYSKNTRSKPPTAGTPTYNGLLIFLPSFLFARLRDKLKYLVYKILLLV
jgi:hypothetical protein